MFLRVNRADDGAAMAPNAPIEFIAATPGTKRDGLDLASMPWRVDNYERNPIITWAHDLRGERLPIGRADVSISDEGDGEVMRAAITFDEADPFAAEVACKYRDGFLHAVSVTWDDVDEHGLTQRAGGNPPVAHELLEIAAVPVPGDQDALIERQRAALGRLRDALDDALDTDESSGERVADATADEPVEPETRAACPNCDCETEQPDAETPDTIERAASGMLAALDRGSDVDDDERRRTYNQADGMYRRLGLDAPEFLTGDELREMDDETWRGLFLSGEVPASERAGATLNRKNKKDLMTARDLIAGVLASAGEGEDDAERSIEALEDDNPLDSLLAAWR